MSKSDELQPDKPSDGLLPCPFCGSTVLFVEPDEVGSGGQRVPPIHVGCTSCQAEQRADDVDEAKAAWNRRSGQCGCIETYPQLVSGQVSHGPGCSKYVAPSAGIYVRPPSPWPAPSAAASTPRSAVAQTFTVTDDMVEAGARKMAQLVRAGIIEKPPLTEWEPWAGSVRAVLEASFARSATQRLSLNRDQVKCIADELHAFAVKVGPSGCGAAVSIGALLDAWLVSNPVGPSTTKAQPFVCRCAGEEGLLCRQWCGSTECL